MKIITANEAAKLISNGMSVGLSGSSATCIVPDRIYEAIEDRYLNFSEPKGLTLVHPQGQGNKDNTGMSRFAHPGLCKKFVEIIPAPKNKQSANTTAMLTKTIKAVLNILCAPLLSPTVIFSDTSFEIVFGIPIVAIASINVYT